jgi:hypothetical protein
MSGMHGLIDNALVISFTFASSLNLTRIQVYGGPGWFRLNEYCVLCC